MLVIRSFNIHRKGKNAIKNKTNTVPNPTTNPNLTLNRRSWKTKGSEIRYLLIYIRMCT